ncbi:DUF2482 family protein [Staphylococcus warneri]|uniref:DUF2482 family protein n=1 Tax=Staphylococcus warneri TaxID=1292 RepID=UPI001F565C9F|nr:DUF2482 family protein [Staphylococcus warneri]MCI2770655.1 DUF2482 family protein [Staphylococcus warneri]MCI2783374.1 DUF2482 family protein [Staphylococcus warneri]
MSELQEYTKAELLDMVTGKMEEVDKIIDDINEQTQFQISQLSLFVLHESDLRKVSDMQVASTINGRLPFISIALLNDDNLTNLVEVTERLKKDVDEGDNYDK